jgi:predicted NodU family carbamoyl transferase
MIGIAARVQEDLANVTMDFVRHFKEKTGETNLCLAGGVRTKLSHELDG